MADRTPIPGGRGFRVRVAAVLALVGALLIGGPVAAASAVAPVSLDVGHVTDDASVLTDEQHRTAD